MSGELEDLFETSTTAEVGGKSFTLKRLTVASLPEAIRLTEAAFGGEGVSVGSDLELVVSMNAKNLSALRSLVLLLCEVGEEDLQAMPATPFFMLVFKIVEFNGDFFYLKLAGMQRKAMDGPSSSSGSAAPGTPSPSATP